MAVMRLLVLGGTHHVGRAVVEEAIARGDEVTTLTRGVSGQSAATTSLHADRTDPAALRAALGDATWDAVIDTWSGAPRVVLDAARFLADRAGHYGYVSSRSVYQWPPSVGLDESGPVVSGDPGSEDSADYAAAKRGGELAAAEGFGAGRTLLARAGLILGPYERVGRMPWWLRRIERGGEVLAPGPADLKLQYIDCRDLARWMLHAADEGISGPFNTVSEPGHATMASLLEAAIDATGSDARLVWVEPEVILAAGIAPWTELPVWLPPGGEAFGLHTGDVTAVYRAGMTCRPVEETVADTWAWLQAEGDPPAPADRPGHGLDPEREREILAGLAG